MGGWAKVSRFQLDKLLFTQLEQRARVLDTPRKRKEWLLCSLKNPLSALGGFLFFCQNYVIIQDKAKGIEVPFRLFRGQRRIAPWVVDGLWILALKGRQVGFTWLFAAYALWRHTFQVPFDSACVAQEKSYAKDFIWRFKFMHHRLPPWMQISISTDNKEELQFGEHGWCGRIRAMAGSEKAARSVTGDLLIIDEASRVEGLKDVLQAGRPALEVAGGQCLIFSTSDGPGGDFHDLWEKTMGDGSGSALDPETGKGPTGFVPVFIHWSERDGRDEEWYRKEKSECDLISPTMVKHEYPNTPEEAWEYAAGRVWPEFTAGSHVRSLVTTLDDVRYRAIDFGQTVSAFVVLWLVYREGYPGLIVHPSCKNTIRELTGYRWDKDREGYPIMKNDHCCDALRYAVVTYKLWRGLVYVYHELYVPGESHYQTIVEDIDMIHEESKWRRAAADDARHWRRGSGEKFEGTVADRSWPQIIREYRQRQIEPIRGQGRPELRDVKKLAKATEHVTELQQGIALVNLLVRNTESVLKHVTIDADQQALTALKRRRLEPKIMRGASKSASTVERDLRAVDLLQRLQAERRRKAMVQRKGGY